MRTERTGIILPYGRHRGRDVADVPAAYLRWFLANCKARAEVMDTIAERLNPELRRKVNIEMAVPVEELSELERRFRATAALLSEALDQKIQQEREK